MRAMHIPTGRRIKIELNKISKIISEVNTKIRKTLEINQWKHIR